MSGASARGSAVHPVGSGQLLPPGSAEAGLTGALRSWRRSASRLQRTLGPDDLEAALPTGALATWPEIDGDRWFLVCEGGDASLADARGRVLRGALPLLEEARDVAGALAGRSVIAGVLYAEDPGDPRPSRSALRALLARGADANARALRFVADDVLEHPGGSPARWADRHRLLRSLLEGGRRLQAVAVKFEARGPSARRRYAAVSSERASGLMIMAEDGRRFRVAVPLEIDVQIVGFTSRQSAPDRVSALLVGGGRRDGLLQILGSVDDLGGPEQERALMAALAPLIVESEHRQANGEGALFRFIQPSRRAAIRCVDARSEDSAERPVRSMALRYEDVGRWTPVRRMHGAELSRASLVRLYDVDAGAPAPSIEQLLARCPITDLEAPATPRSLPQSELIRREVYTRALSGGLAVRKLLVWRTNKELLDPDFPAWVIHFTDYSPGRREPLQRTVWLAPDAQTASAIADALLRERIKSGWARADWPPVDIAAVA